ncbi:MAG: exo-alpha-sialidase [Armatimonadetes bacterium]|nr:exo-alpha-sialidase [Armatimonadota bacterium]MDE2205984.1 exo-alpha-sialidase [Armatimonadota bacterium]
MAAGKLRRWGLAQTKLQLTCIAAIAVCSLGAACRGHVSGSAALQQKSGQAPQPADARLTTYNKEVGSPQVQAGRDGSIHVAFVEATNPGLEDFVFYRSSTDGGKSWSAPVNLSQDMPGHMVGPCRLAVDGQNRVYVVWRAIATPNTGLPSSRGPDYVACNLFYRSLSNGQWGPITPINAPLADPQNQRIGIGSFFAAADPTGKVHVAYSVNTDVFHPELMFQAGTKYAQHQAAMGTGSVAEVDLDGNQHSAPREVFLTTVTPAGAFKACDGLSLLDGYFDASGAPHFVAEATANNEPFGQTRIAIVEGGKQTTAVTLPTSTVETYPPWLLVDAQGRNHIIVDFGGGEEHSVRDYVAGTGQYTVLKTETPVHFPIRGFQAGQGPAGTMAVVMELNANGLDDGETWIAIYDGKAWRPAVQLTHYKTMDSGTYTALGLRSSVTTVGHWNAGATGAVTIDNTGHVLLVHEADHSGSVAVQGGGVTGVGGGTSSPELLFHHF